ncbi:predicted protein [Uncinocarpus reesii 1704]|uniref:Uncharacterized protein n=1 Tax=Uncinocarpus reesii (strain UAMH 1704) TaxID=336963 RepID=C4JQK1_UNCRE|nr:uncharacterized protein UREG_03346 [Uncinocarpus reesii 1704]EEP78500.1 predicted protein [Uncinocarpus reesii 1704]
MRSRVVYQRGGYRLVAVWVQTAVCLDEPSRCNGSTIYVKPRARLSRDLLRREDLGHFDIWQIVLGRLGEAKNSGWWDTITLYIPGLDLQPWEKATVVWCTFPLPTSDRRGGSWNQRLFGSASNLAPDLHSPLDVMSLLLVRATAHMVHDGSISSSAGLDVELCVADLRHRAGLRRALSIIDGPPGTPKKSVDCVWQSAHGRGRGARVLVKARQTLGLFLARFKPPKHSTSRSGDNMQACGELEGSHRPAPPGRCEVHESWFACPWYRVYVFLLPVRSTN